VKNKVPAPSTSKMTIAGGLADTYDVWEKQYGDNKGDKVNARFKNDYLLTMFTEGRATNITMQFESTNQPARSKTQAMVAYQNMIPTDAVED
jgi:hypothetical protein